MEGTIMATRKVRARMARLVALVIGLPALAIGLACAQTPKRQGVDVSVVTAGPLVPPRVAPPCKPGSCPFAGQTVTVLAFKGQPITGAIHEVKEEFEAATGARLDIVEVSFNEHCDNFVS